MRVLRQQDDAGVGRVGVSVSERNSMNALLSKASIFFCDDLLKCTRSVKIDADLVHSKRGKRL